MPGINSGAWHADPVVTAVGDGGMNRRMAFWDAMHQPARRDMTPWLTHGADREIIFGHDINHSAVNLTDDDPQTLRPITVPAGVGVKLTLPPYTRRAINLQPVTVLFVKDIHHKRPPICRTGTKFIHRVTVT